MKRNSDICDVVYRDLNQEYDWLLIYSIKGASPFKLMQETYITDMSHDVLNKS